MSDPEQRQSSVRAWVDIAEEDFGVTGMALAADPPYLQTALFHSQQTGEKYLKALLVWRGGAFPRTHDLKLLLELALPSDGDLVALRPACFRLSELGVEPRYPMPPPAPGLEQAEEAHADAAALRLAIRERLQAALAAEQ